MQLLRFLFPLPIRTTLVVLAMQYCVPQTAVTSHRTFSAITLFQTVSIRMADISKQHNGASVTAVAQFLRDQVNRHGIIAGECISSPQIIWRAGAIWKVTGLVE